MARKTKKPTLDDFVRSRSRLALGSYKLSPADRLRLLEKNPVAICNWPSSTQQEQLVVIKQDCNAVTWIKNPTPFTRMKALDLCPDLILTGLYANGSDREFAFAISKDPKIVLQLTSQFKPKWLAFALVINPSLQKLVDKEPFYIRDDFAQALHVWGNLWKKILNKSNLTEQEKILSLEDDNRYEKLKHDYNWLWKLENLSDEEMAYAYSWWYKQLEPIKSTWPIPYSRKIRNLALNFNPYLIRHLRDASDLEITRAIMNEPRVVRTLRGDDKVWFWNPKWLSLARLITDQKGSSVPDKFLTSNFTQLKQSLQYDKLWKKILNLKTEDDKFITENQEARDHVFERWLENYVEEKIKPFIDSNDPTLIIGQLSFLIDENNLSQFTGKPKSEIIGTYLQMLAPADRLEIVKRRPRLIEWMKYPTQADQDEYISWYEQERSRTPISIGTLTNLQNPSERSLYRILSNHPDFILHMKNPRDRHFMIALTADPQIVLKFKYSKYSFLKWLAFALQISNDRDQKFLRLCIPALCHTAEKTWGPYWNKILKTNLSESITPDDKQHVANWVKDHWPDTLVSMMNTWWNDHKWPFMDLPHLSPQEKIRILVSLLSKEQRIELLQKQAHYADFFENLTLEEQLIIIRGKNPAAIIPWIKQLHPKARRALLHDRPLILLRHGAHDSEWQIALTKNPKLVNLMSWTKPKWVAFAYLMADEADRWRIKRMDPIKVGQALTYWEPFWKHFIKDLGKSK